MRRLLRRTSGCEAKGPLLIMQRGSSLVCIRAIIYGRLGCDWVVRCQTNPWAVA
jgi:hypothetical protein